MSSQNFVKVSGFPGRKKCWTFSFDWRVSCKSDVNKYLPRESLEFWDCNHEIGRTDFLIARHLVSINRVYFQHKSISCVAYIKRKCKVKVNFLGCLVLFDNCLLIIVKYVQKLLWHLYFILKFSYVSQKVNKLLNELILSSRLQYA